MEFLRFLSTIRTPVLDTFMLWISYLGTPFVLIGIFEWYYLNVNKEGAYGMSLAFCFSGLFCQGTKLVVRMPRPWNLDPTFQAVEAAVPSAEGYSFPSIHTQSVVSVLGSIVYLSRHILVKAIMTILIVLVMFSRMYLGVHTPLDVFGALLFTVVISGIIWIRWNSHRRSFDEQNMLKFFMPAFAVVLLCLTAALLVNGTVDYSNAKNSFETVGAALGFSFAYFIEPRYIRFSVEGSVVQKILRFLIAIAGAAAIILGLKALFGTGVPMLVIRYFLTIAYLTILVPLICIRTGLCSRTLVKKRLPQI